MQTEKLKKLLQVPQKYRNENILAEIAAIAKVPTFSNLVSK